MPDLAARWVQPELRGAVLWPQRPIDCGIKCKLQSRIQEAPVTGSRIFPCQAFDGVSLHRIRAKGRKIHGREDAYQLGAGQLDGDWQNLENEINEFSFAFHSYCSRLLMASIPLLKIDP